jgi:hypothetical protein
VGIGPNRSAATPRALKAHAALVLLAALIVWDRHRPGSWVGLVLVAIVTMGLLSRSLLMWWVQVVAVGFALSSVYETHIQVSGAGVDLSTFVDPSRLLALTVLLAVAGALLFLPSVRRSRERDPRLGRTGLVVGVLVIASFPAMGLAVENRLPSTYGLGEVAGGSFLGNDPDRGITYYATWRKAGTCLVALATHMTRTECQNARSLHWNKLTFRNITRDACIPPDFEVPAVVEDRFCRLVPG